MRDCRAMVQPAFHARRFGGSFSRQLAMLCLCAVFLLKALIPAGFMPDLSRDDAFTLVICTATGPQTVLVDKDMKPLTGDDASSSHHSSDDTTQTVDHVTLCPFAVNTAMDHVSSVAGVKTVSVAMMSQNIFPVFLHYERIRFFGNASSQSPPFSFYI